METCLELRQTCCRPRPLAVVLRMWPEIASGVEHTCRISVVVVRKKVLDVLCIAVCCRGCVCEWVQVWNGCGMACTSWNENENVYVCP